MVGRETEIQPVRRQEVWDPFREIAALSKGMNRLFGLTRWPGNGELEKGVLTIQGERREELDAIQVRNAMSKQLFSCHSADPVTEAERLMREKQVRRLPVVDAEKRPVGILTLNDLAREAGRVSGRRTVAADAEW